VGTFVPEITADCTLFSRSEYVITGETNVPTITECSDEYTEQSELAVSRLQCFRTPTVVGKWRPIPLKFVLKVIHPPPFEHNDFVQYPLIVDITMLRCGKAVGR